MSSSIEKTTKLQSFIAGRLKGSFSASVHSFIEVSPDEDIFGTTDVRHRIIVPKGAKFTYSIHQQIGGSATDHTLDPGDYHFLYEVKSGISPRYSIEHYTYGIRDQLLKSIGVAKSAGLRNIIPILVVDDIGYQSVLTQIRENPHSPSVRNFIAAFNALVRAGGGINIVPNLRGGAEGRLDHFIRSMP